MKILIYDLAIALSNIVGGKVSNKSKGITILILSQMFLVCNYMCPVVRKAFAGYQGYASAFNIAVFNVGIAIGAYVGGLVASSIRLLGAIVVLLAVALNFIKCSYCKKVI